MKFITSILLFSAFTQAFAQESKSVTFKNLTYPDQSFTAECFESSCSAIVLRIEGQKRLLTLPRIESTINNRTKFNNTYIYRPYELTKQSAKNAKRRYTEAYYGDAIGNYALMLGSAIIDTAGLPISAISNLVSTSHQDSRADQKGAKRFKLNFESNLNEVVVKHKYYAQMKNYLYHVSSEMSDEGETESLNELIVRLNPTSAGEQYRCQLATSGCYRDGGRYGVYINAVDEETALVYCNEISNSVGNILCQAVKQ